MANQYFNQFHFSPVPMLTAIFAKISFGAAGAPTLITAGGASKAVASVSRNDEGDFSITLSDTYNLFKGINASYVAANGPAAPDVNVKSETVSSTKIVRILTQAGGVNTDPAEGEVLCLEIMLKNSSAF
jgi:hypothetical protein